MSYYPIAIDLKGRRCLVVGGGSVALRKVEALLEYGAEVIVVAPEVQPEIAALADGHRIVLCRRPYEASDLQGAAVVIAATDDPEVNAAVSRDAASAGVLVNVVDQPELCSFIVPATVRRGDLTLAIYTAGKSPALARRLRERLEKEFGPEYGALADLMGEMREEVKRRYSNRRDREAALRRMLDAGLLEDLRDGNPAEAKRKALECIW